jgi:glycine betaine catabolism B
MADLLLPDLRRASPLWDGERDDTLVCRQVRQETHDVKTFMFSAASARLMRYAPGQFMTFELEIGERIMHRCYTLSSTPTRPDMLSITVKRVPGGTVSNWLHDHLQEGDNVRVLGPAGEFSCFLQPPAAAPKYLFLSAGSGITPLMSMSRAMHDLARGDDIVFVHSARTPADIIFAQELELMARNLAHFRLGLVCERRGDYPMWAGFTGQLNLAVLHNIAVDFLQREVYTCGPAPYMAAVRRMLEEAGFDMAHYHEESFSFDAAPVETSGSAVQPTTQETDQPPAYRLHFSRSGDAVTCEAGQTVLQAALAAGMRMPTSCTRGLCGTCKTKMVSGQVDMQHAGGIRQREIDQGWILPCCSKPLSDLVLER